MLGRQQYNVLSILAANNCYEELNRSSKEVLHNTLTLFQANLLVIYIKMTKVVGFTPQKLFIMPIIYYL
jgi:hypothetical protein